MLLSRDYVGYMAKEIVKRLVAGKMIEVKNVETTTTQVRGVMAEEVTIEERINEEVREILAKYSEENADDGRFVSGDVQKSEAAAGSRKEVDPPLMRLSREKTIKLSHQVTDLLVASPDVDFVEDRDTIRTEIVNIITALLKVEEQVDAEVRAKIASQKKEILEGSEEWDILFRKYYAEGLKRMGVAEVVEKHEHK